MVRTEFTRRLTGVAAVLVAPFMDGTGAIDPGVAEFLARRCDEAGVHTITALGNTAEVWQLDQRERHELLRATAAGRSSAALIAGVSGPFADLVRSAEAAAELGYDAVMVHEPADAFASDVGIQKLITELADRSPLPLILYIRSSRLSRKSLIELTHHDAIVAIKYAVPDLLEAAALLSRGDLRGDCIWICGLAESMVPSFAALGVRGFTSGIAGVWPSLSLAIYEAAATSNAMLLSECVRRILPIELLRNSNGGRYNVAVLKAALKHQGINAGTVRPPCVPLDRALMRDLAPVLDELSAQSSVGLVEGHFASATTVDGTLSVDEPSQRDRRSHASDR